ncbi:MAG: hypothetical protein R6U32_01845 [Candidatus Woesearchaeota archaeon]
MGTKKMWKDVASFESILPSIKRVREGIYLIPFPMLSDFLLAFIYGFLIMGVMGSMVTSRLLELGGEIVGSGMEKSNLSFSQLFLQESIRPVLFRVAAYTILMIAALYLLYSVMQGISWWYCRRISGVSNKKRSDGFEGRAGLKRYILSFSRVNLFWFLVFIIYNMLAWARDFLSPAEDPGVGLLPAVLLIALAYFASISYLLLPWVRGWKNIKASFSCGVRKAGELVPAYFLVAAVLIIIDFILYYSLRADGRLALALGIILLLPALSWARIYIHLVVERSAGHTFSRN